MRNTSRRPTRRIPRTIAAAATAATLTLGAGAGSASASSAGCTGGGEGVDQVCLAINGSGLHVDNFVVRHDDLGSVAGVPAPTPEQICNYQATLTIDPPGDNNAYVRDSSFHEGCSWGVAWFEFSGGDYPDGTRVCGRFYEHRGEQQGGAPCNTIHN